MLKYMRGMCTEKNWEKIAFKPKSDILTDLRYYRVASLPKRNIAHKQGRICQILEKLFEIIRNINVQILKSFEKERE